MKILLLVLLISLGVSQKCAFYKCEEKPEKLGFFFANDQVCGKRSQEEEQVTFELKACPKGQMCDIKFGEADDKCTLPTQIPQFYNGEFCESKEQCLKGDCVGGKCKGKGEGEGCPQGDLECDIGFGCVNALCKKLVEEGAACSATDRCASHLVCHDSKCVKAGSVLVGQSCFAPLACETYYTEADGTGYICTNGPHLKDMPSGTQQCGSAQDTCTYDKKVRGYSVPLSDSPKCSCGRTQSGDAFCPLGRGDLNKEITTVSLFSYS
jgi:hypothetical protein